VLARVANMSLDRTTKACAPFLIPLLVTLALVTYWPGMVMWLPRIFYQ
jgi:TRAP-type C4-dicarboxylate transport system permease large subunit